MKKEKLNIIYEDKHLIVVNKKTNLLTIADHNHQVNLYSQVYDYLKQKHKSNKVFIVHRLDKDTSGLIVFAKNEEVKKQLQDNWEQTKRYYYAIVHGKVDKIKDTLNSYLAETKTFLVYETSKNKGKLAITNYELLKNNNKYSLLKIDIKTGRKNQIRVQLNNINHPILGDKKYGIKDNFKRLYLHAYYLEFIHPVTREFIQLEIPYPVDFVKIIA